MPFTEYYEKSGCNYFCKQELKELFCTRDPDKHYCNDFLELQKKIDLNPNDPEIKKYIQKEITYSLNNLNEIKDYNENLLKKINPKQSVIFILSLPFLRISKQKMKTFYNILVKCTILIWISLTFLTTTIVTMDAPQPFQIGLQTPATPIMEGITNFHNHIMFFLVGIACFVFWLLYRCLALFAVTKIGKQLIAQFTHSTFLEVTWTVVPTFILFFVAVPSFTLLYATDEMVDPSVTLKTTGHQWYWSALFNYLYFYLS
jgi:hypothetical protein